MFLLIYIKVVVAAATNLCIINLKQKTMTTKILKLLQMLVYLAITSQLLFYLLILSDSLKYISLANFIELRKVVDGMMETRFRIIYYSGLILTLAVVILAARKPGSMFFITSSIALVCLIIDVTIAMKGNIPINALINSYTNENNDHDWQALRLEWLRLINIRGIFAVTGMISLFIGFIWQPDAHGN